jgi:hypothetical protein
VITKFNTIDYGHISYLGSFKWIQLHIIMRRWLRSELPLLVVVVYLPRIQILVGQSWAGTTLKGWPFGLSGRGSLSNYYIIYPSPFSSPLPSPISLYPIYHMQIMCRRGVDQTGRLPDVWALICPGSKAVQPLPPAALSTIPSYPRSYLDRIDIKNVFFNPELAWGAFSKLAVPAPLPQTRDRQVVQPARRGASKLSRLESLPVELLSMVVEESGLEKTDIIALGLSSTLLWEVVVTHVQASYRKAPAPWAGSMFWCQGNYATTLPDAFLSQSQKDADEGKEWAAQIQNIQSAGRSGMCPARRFFWSAHREYATHVDAWVQEEGWKEAARGHRAKSGMERGVWKMVEKGLVCPEFWPREREWVLRNLTTREIVESEVLRERERKRKRKGTISFDDVLLMRTYWSIPNSRDVVGIKNGVWAGHRFDIVTGEKHRAEGGLGDWKDVTEEVYVEAEMLRTKIMASQTGRRGF